MNESAKTQKERKWLKYYVCRLLIDVKKIINIYSSSPAGGANEWYLKSHNNAVLGTFSFI